MPKQNWRKKSADSRKITTFADCLCAEKTLSSRPFDPSSGLRDRGLRDLCLSRILKSRVNNSTIQQSTIQQHNGDQQQIQPSGS